jgi:copper chaperone CopZ
LFKVLAATATGLIGGWLSDRVPEDDSITRDLGSAGGDHDATNVEGPRSLGAMLAHAHSLLASIWRWLVFGILVSALINTYLPMGTLNVFADLGPLGAGFAVLLISLPLYVCATASVPIAAAMVANGMPVGAALVFLMAGPATNVATIGAIYRGFGPGQLAVYLGVLIVGSIGFGAMFDLGIGVGASPLGVLEHNHGLESPAWWAVGSALFMAGLIARLAFLDLARFVRAHWPAGASEEIEITVAGLTCGMCERKLEGALLDVEGVLSAVVSRNPDRARVRGSADRASIDQAISTAGYRAI